MGAREQNYEQTFEGGQEERKHRREVHPRLQEDHDGRNSYFQKAQRLHEMLQGYDSKRYIDCVGMYRAVQFFVGTLWARICGSHREFCQLAGRTFSSFSWLADTFVLHRSSSPCWILLDVIDLATT